MNWAHHLLQANIYLVVFYGFYKLLLDRETYFTLNRLYLIAAGVFSLIIPFLKFDWFAQQPMSKPFFVGVDQFNQLITDMSVVPDRTNQLSTGDWVVLFYLTGVLFCSVRLIYLLLSVKRFLKNRTLGTAFSFFRKKHVDQALPQAQTINKHEEIHMNQLHSLDVLFFELLGIINWFNPVIYLYKNTAKNIHEYLADEEAAKFQGNKKEYALLLLSSAFGVPSNSLTNNFHKKSLIKKRIFMLHKERSRKTAILKYGLFVPLFGFMLLLSSATLRYNEKMIKMTTDIPLDESLTLVKDLVKETGNLANSMSTTDKQTITAANEGMAISKYGAALPLLEAFQEKVYDFVKLDTQPSFPGGMKEFYNYLKKSVKYPAAAVKANIQGKVFLSYIVEKDGKLSNIEVTRSVGYGIDEEAVRVLKESPAWIPGVVDHKKVRVKYNIPIAFNLAKPDKVTPKKPAMGAVKKVNDNNRTGSVNATVGTAKTHSSFLPKKVSSFSTANGLPLNMAPLYVIDGVKADEAAMKAVDSKNIKEINVLKDAKAVMIYGEEAKNGVILITTKNSNKYIDYVRPKVLVDKKL